MIRSFLFSLLLLLALFPMVLAAQAPANDLCVDAQALAIGSGQVSGTTVNTVLEVAPSFGGSGACASGYGVWYTFPGTGATAEVSSRSLGSLDHAMTIFTTSGGCATTYTLVTCENSAGPAATERHTFLTSSGTTYYVYIADYRPNGTAAQTGDFVIEITTTQAPPSNDQCPASTNLLIGKPFSGTVTNATNSNIPGNCSFNTPSTQRFDDDVWFSFVANAVSMDLVTTGQFGSTDLVYEVFSGPCPALTSIFCTDQPSFSIPGLISGELYRMRVASINTTPQPPGGFTLTINPTPPPPANNVCSGATPAAVGLSGTCPSGAGLTSASFLGVTQSNTGGACSISPPYDRWYTWTATAPSLEFTQVTAASIQGIIGISVYSGICGSLIYAGCTNFNNALIGNLTVGTPYFIQIWSSVKAETSTPLAWCLSEGPSCATPTGLTVNRVTSSTVRVNFNAFAVGGHVVEYGAPGFTPGTGTTVAVATGGTVTLTGLMPTTNYAVYVRANCNGTNVGPVAFTTTGTPPGNDNCTAATSLIVNGPAVSGTTFDATDSGVITGCTFTNQFDDDVWFSFVANAAFANVKTTTVSGSDNRSYEVFSGTCNSLTSIACSDPENFTINGLTAGQTYYIRVASFFQNGPARSAFTIAVDGPFPLPANDECGMATVLTVNGATVAGTTRGATNSGVMGTCQFQFAFNDDVWYRFVATNTQVNLVTSAQSGNTMDLAYEWFTGSCGTLTSVECRDAESFAMTNLTVGEVYYLRVATYVVIPTVTGSFSLNLTATPSPPGNDNCAMAAALFTSGGAATAANGKLYNTTDATAGGQPAQTCGSPAVAAGNDIWFTVDAPVAGRALTVKAIGAPDFDGVLKIFTGVCGSLTQVGCANGTGAGGTETVTILTSFTGGGSGPSTAPTTYYVQLADLDATGGSVEVSATLLAAPLPVTLTHFSARADGPRNVIEWAAAAEVDLASYTVERASNTDAAHFTTVASVSPRGTTSGVEAIYNAYDASPARITYYRLRAVDLDGSVDYSDVVAVTRSNTVRGGAIKLYPNPARGQTSVKLDLSSFQDDAVDVRVSDAAGRLVSSTRCAAGATHELSLAGLATGMYTVSAITPTGVSTERLVIE